MPPSHSLGSFIIFFSIFTTLTYLCWVQIVCNKQSGSWIDYWLHFIYMCLQSRDSYLASPLGPAIVWFILTNVCMCMRWDQGFSFVCTNILLTTVRWFSQNRKPWKEKLFSEGTELPTLSLLLILKICTTLLFYFIMIFLLFRATSVAYGYSQARGWMRAVAAGLHHSHSNTGSKPCLQPTPQLMAMPDP